MGKKRRKHYAIEKLHPDIKEAVDEMIKADFTYNEIVDYIKSTGNSISKSAVQRYASNLMQSLQTLRMAQENFKAIMDETERYKDVDFTEPLTRLLCSQLLEQIGKLSEEQLQAADIETLTKNAVALTRAVAYKKNIDIKTKGILENGADQFMLYAFEAMYEENPKLYKEVRSFVKDKLETS